jgi:hypothetical protein
MITTTSTTRHWQDIYPLATGWRPGCACSWTGQYLGGPERSTAVTEYRARRASTLRWAAAARSYAARAARRQSATAGCHRW